MMNELKTVILTRYLLLIAHFVIVLSLMMSRDANVKASLPFSYTKDEYKSRDTDFLVDLSLSIGFLAVEFITFGSGLTMFSSLPTVVSIMSHFGSTVALTFFAIDEWDSRAFWFVFGFGNCIPVTFDFGSIFLNLCANRLKYTS